MLSLAWPDIIIGTVLSLVVYAVVFLLGRSPHLARMLNPLAAFVAAILAYAIAATLVPGSNYRMVTLCAVIALIPNPGLVLGIGELSNNHVLSGGMRLMSAIVVLIELAFGAFLGMAIASALMSIPAGTAAASLAPGYAAYLGLGTLQASGVAAGFGAEFKVLESVAWIIGGLFIAKTVIPPKSTL